MSDLSSHTRYEAWLEQEAGGVAAARCNDMLRALLSGWPRRSRSLLVFNVGTGRFLETLWEAGFDVTGQDSVPEYLAMARERLGQRAEFVLSSPAHLPFDDCFFDYALVPATAEFWQHQEAILKEVRRLACSGVIFVFPNAWSLFSLECRLRKGSPLCVSARPLLHSPRQLVRLARQVFGRKKTAWCSVLPAPSPFWKKEGILSCFNSPLLPLPLGAFAGYRIDLGPLCAGTPLFLRHSNPVAAE